MTKYTKRGMPLVRNCETQTEAQFWAMFRNALRKLTMYWKPGNAYLKDIRRPNQGENKKLRFEYPCEQCQHWFRREDVELDHKVECGEINSWQTLAQWGERAFIEKDQGWQCLCSTCHRIKTNSTRKQ